MSIKIVTAVIATAACLFLLGLFVALAMVASRPPPIAQPKDVFDFTSLRAPPSEIPSAEPAALQGARRRGTRLPHLRFDRRAHPDLRSRLVVSRRRLSRLAAALSLGGAAKVVLPNLRGHYQSGRHRGDVEYIGQLEDDARRPDRTPSRTGSERPDHARRPFQRRRFRHPLCGRRTRRGGVELSAAGSRDPDLDRDAARRRRAAGPTLHLRRLYGLLALDAIGIHGFDGLSIIEFNKPAKFWDGTETLVVFAPAQRVVSSALPIPE